MFELGRVLGANDAGQKDATLFRISLRFTVQVQKKNTSFKKQLSTCKELVMKSITNDCLLNIPIFFPAINNLPCFLYRYDTFQLTLTAYRKKDNQMTT